jgi:hypothetical protein
MLRSSHYFKQRLLADRRRRFERAEEVECLAEVARAAWAVGKVADQVAGSLVDA